MKVHVLKTWCEYYDAVNRGFKHFEVRKNDRDFEVGDLLVLVRFDPVLREHTMPFRTIAAEILYITPPDCPFLLPGHVVMGMWFGLSRDKDRAADDAFRKYVAALQSPSAPKGGEP